MTKFKVIPCNCGTALCWLDNVWHKANNQPKFLHYICEWHDWYIITSFPGSWIREPKKCRNFALILDRIKVPKFLFKLLKQDSGYDF